MTGCLRNCRLTAIGLVLAGFTAFLCGFFASPAHACCGESQNPPDTSMSCCCNPAAPNTAAVLKADFQPDLKATTPPVTPALKDFFIGDPATDTGTIAKTYTPDQSRRYLALRVLRN